VHVRCRSASPEIEGEGGLEGLCEARVASRRTFLDAVCAAVNVGICKCGDEGGHRTALRKSEHAHDLEVMSGEVAESWWERKRCGGERERETESEDRSKMVKGPL
jgi:hypothetical protein